MEKEFFEIEGVVLLKRKVFSDERGMFTELYNHIKFEKNSFDIKQCNFSVSKKNVIRGLHMQDNPNQAKLV